MIGRLGMRARPASVASRARAVGYRNIPVSATFSPDALRIRLTLAFVLLLAAPAQAARVTATASSPTREDGSRCASSPAQANETTSS